MSYSFSENIQRGILYLLKTNRDFYLQIVNLVKPEYFEFPAHAKIYEAVTRYYKQYHKLPTDDFIIEDVKKHLGDRESVSDYQDEIIYINRLDHKIIDNPEYILDLIETFAKKEEMKSAIAQSIDLIRQDRVEEVEELVRSALKVSRDIDTGQDYFRDLGDRYERVFNEEVVPKFKTVLPTLNDSLEGGLGAKELALVIAPPGVGKSLYLVNQGVAAMKQGKKVLYISLEMGEDKIAQRFDSIMSLLPQGQLKTPGSQLSLKNRLEIFKDEFSGCDLVIKEFPSTQGNVNTIRNLMVQLRNHEDFVPDVLIVDYLELLRPIRDQQAEYEAQQTIARELRGVAMEYGILVWSATQTNRMGRKVKIITDAELGDSYGKIRTCDFAISLNQTEEEYDNNQMRCFVVKSRNGRPRFIVPMSINYDTLVMGEY